MKSGCLFIFLVVLLGCVSEQITPDTEKDTYQDTLPKQSSPFKNFTFQYPTNTINIAEGDTFISSLPFISGTFSGINFFLSGTTDTSFFTKIDSSRFGIFKNPPVGFYGLDVQIIKDNQDSLFRNVFSLTVTSSAIRNLYFENPHVILPSRQNFTSIEPKYKGSKPVNFFLITEPNMPSVSINNANGKISVDKSVLPGFYQISVTTKNSLGFQSFTNVMTISVGGVLNQSPDAVSFQEVIAPIISSNCKRCHPGYESYTIAYNNAENIYDRVSRLPGDIKKMPQNATLLDSEIQAIKKWIDTEKNP